MRMLKGRRVRLSGDFRQQCEERVAAAAARATANQGHFTLYPRDYRGNPLEELLKRRFLVIMKTISTHELVVVHDENNLEWTIPYKSIVPMPKAMRTRWGS